jgi:AraC-like DNA-binding protein
MVSLPVTSDPAAETRRTADPHSWRLGSLVLSHGAQAALAPPSQGALLLIPVGQSLCLRRQSLPQILPPPVDLLYLPAGETDLRVGAFTGWRLGLNLEELSLVAAELSEYRLSPARFHRHLKQAQPLELSSDHRKGLCTALVQLLQIGTSAALRRQGQLELLELDQLILRLVVLLLCGDQIHAAQQDSGMDPAHRNRVFEELLAWIQSHLNEPIHLQDLVRQSGYSQRSLRNFFQERFGCGPALWIRRQRLQIARARLLSPQPDDTVGAIAAELGYGHPSQFSRDFQQAFGSRPSSLLREGRRSCGLTCSP